MSKQLPDKKYDFKRIETDVSGLWKSHPQIIKNSITYNPKKPMFSSLEGPPTANAPPGLHHVVARVFKDLYNRYKFMQGFTVPRKGGWDCHGLPVEVQVEKRLGLKTKKEVLTFGVNKFIDECKSDVFRFIKDWDYMTDKMAYWVDLKDPYRTLDTPYMESVWWSLSEMHKKGLLYKGYKVVPYCPRCETPLSSHEVASGYQDVEDDTVAVRLKLKGEKNTYLLAWTTTPWTLLSNLCAAVNPDIKYSYVEHKGEILILATDRVSHFFTKPKILKEVSGNELLGKEYEPIFKHFVGKINKGKKAWIVVPEDYVTTADGSGVVHQAPAFGEIDYDSCKRHNIDFVNPVAKDGSFTNEIPEFAGRFVKDCDGDIIAWLDKNGFLYKSEKYMHSYPFCWRCNSPLLYYAMDSWFIAASKFQKKMVDLNKQISWYPNHIQDGRFGNWIEGAKDWALSRNKFWGTPLPVWVCDKCEHMTPIGSIKELESKSTVKVKIDDLHIPTVDKIKIECEKCGSQMSRTPEVIDCWYDSGSAPFAQYHYPFENKEMFDKSFPYGFIAEAIDQTRGWFYVMHVISTILFNKPAYLSCAVAGLMCDDQGEKMSKSKGNIVKPLEIFDEVGVDAVRVLMCSYSLGDNVKFGREPFREIVIPFFTTLWNTYYFTQEYMQRTGLDGLKCDKKKLGLEDKWMISRANSLVEDVTSHMERHEYNHAITAMQDFVINDFSRGYIKLVRERTSEEDAELAYVFRYALERVVKMMAPFTPYLSEEMFQTLRSKDSEVSVHLEKWPVVEKGGKKVELETSMEMCKTLVQAILQSRDKAQVGTRWPLGEILILSKDEAVKEAVKVYGDLIKQQANVKSIRFIEKFDNVTYTMKPEFKRIGEDYGLATGDILVKLKSFDEQKIIQGVLKGSFEFDVVANVDDKKEHIHVKLEEKHVVLTKHIAEPYTGAEIPGGSMYMDTTLTEDLENEGYAREIVRRIQQLRKDAKLEKSQKVNIFIWSDTDMHEMLKDFVVLAKDKVGAKKLNFSTKMPEASDYKFQKEDKIRNKTIRVLMNMA